MRLLISEPASAPCVFRLTKKYVPLLFKSTNAAAPPHQIHLNFGLFLHAHLIKTSQIHHNLIQTNSLINLYTKCSRISSARRLFDEMPERNVVSWATLMAGYLQTGLSADALSLFVSMMNDRKFLRPNKYVLATVISSCANIQAWEEGKQFHAYAFKSGLMLHPYVGNTLIHMYCRCSDIDGALRAFKTMPQVDSFSCNAMVCGLLEHGFLGEALDVLNMMLKGCVCWDHTTYATVLGLCASLKDLKLGSQVHNHTLKRGMTWNVYIGSSIVDMYGKCGELVSARNAFDQSLVRNIVSWTSIMTCYFQSGHFEEALNLFSEMQLDDVQPNEFTFAVMLNCCANLPALRHGDVLNAHALKSGFKKHLIVENALINMYSKSGSIDDAYKVFSGMMVRDVVSWNSIISGYSRHGLGGEALKVFQCMLEVGEVPNYVTLVGVLSSCAHLGLVEDGFYFLNHFMKKLKIRPGLEHYTCIVGLLSRAGLLDDAETFIRSTPIEKDVVAWRTLLTACQVHRNFGLGKKVAEIILQLDPDDVGTYILLSNIYAKLKRWDGVVNIRKMMRSGDIKKEPGVSWVQLRNSTHVFVSGGKNHPQWNQIHEKIMDLVSQIKLIGYIPDISTVLHDVEDEQKEEYLHYHSEKLAIAFGLINTPVGAAIHVIKNLRICGDCHMAAKLISKVTNRKIIMRDASRFHCFDGGICSCGDYW
ncbi:hypothetical protein ACLOJK_029166 [Asimina triloba]